MKSSFRSKVRRALIPLGALGMAAALAAPITSASGTTADPASKLSPRLVALATGAPRSGHDVADNQPGGLDRRPNGDVVVEMLLTSTSPGSLAAVTSAGANVTAVSTPENALNDLANPGGKLYFADASIAPPKLLSVAAVDVVRSITEVVTPERRIGAVTSEGDTALKAAAARAAYGVDGTGVMIGVLSDSYDQHPTNAATTAAQDVASGDLPGPGNPNGHTTAVNVIADGGAGETDEGRAMLQTVHDIAPGATLAFATGDGGETQMANNIIALKNAGAKIIVDDLTYGAEPFYQDGPISVAVNTVRAAGVAYFSSAGNNNLTVGGNNVSSYEQTTYRGTTCPAAITGHLDCANFNPSGTDNTFGMTMVNQTATQNGTLKLDLQWAQPWGGVTTDFDIYVLDGSGNILASQTTNNVTNQVPNEILSYVNNTGSAQALNIVVARRVGTGVRFKWVHQQDGGNPFTSMEYSTSTGGDVFGPTIFGHNGAGNTFSVAAVPASNLTVPEGYTGNGPVTLLFQPVPSTTALGSPSVLAKPDFAAVDCVSNTFFPAGSTPTHVFCGTSDAAPHAAAVAALVLQAQPSLTAAQIGAVLAGSAIPVGSPAAAPAVVGAGLIQADRAVNRALQPPTLTCTQVVTGNVSSAPSVSGAGNVLCLNNANVIGTVNVTGGASLVTSGSQIYGGIVGNGATQIRVCGTAIAQPSSGDAINVTGTTLATVIGDPVDGCAADRLLSPVTVNANGGLLLLGGSRYIGPSNSQITVTLNNNTGFPIVRGDQIYGALNCSGNTKAPVNGGTANQVYPTESGQCAGL